MVLVLFVMGTVSVVGVSADTADTYIKPEVFLYGDVDLDGVLTVKDATYVQKYIAELDVPSHSFWEPELVFDFNKDEDLSIKDATAIQKYLVGLPY